MSKRSKSKKKRRAKKSAATRKDLGIEQVSASAKDEEQTSTLATSPPQSGVVEAQQDRSEEGKPPLVTEVQEIPSILQFGDNKQSLDVPYSHSAQSANAIIRLSAFLFDALFLTLLNICSLAFFGFRILANFLQPVADVHEPFAFTRIQRSLLIVASSLFILNWLYLTLGESLPFQGTLGKKIFYLKTTDHEGRKISFLRANFRTLGKLASLATLGVGYAISLFRKDRRTLHDIMSDTFVLKDC